MKVLHIIRNRHGGAYTAASVLNTYLSNNGVESDLFLGEVNKKFKYSIVNKYSMKVGWWLENKLFEPRFIGHPFSTNIFGQKLSKKIKSLQPDIIHIHWIGGAFWKISDLMLVNKLPSVITLHDSWFFTGGCHLPSLLNCTKFITACSMCPLMKNKPNCKYVLRSFLHKIELLNSFNNAIFIAPSVWMLKQAKQSRILSNKEIIHIPNGIDQNIFYPYPSEQIKNKLNLSDDSKVIFFGALNASCDLNKGKSIIFNLIDKLSTEKLVIIIVGDTPKFFYYNKAKIVQFGFINSRSEIAKLLSIANVAIVPSKVENLSYTILEALSCGTPAIAFDLGGNKEIISHGCNGYLVKPFEINEMADYVKKTFNFKREYFMQRCIKTINDNFSIDLIVKQYLNAYNTLI